MRIDVVTLFPDFLRQAASAGVTGRAFERGLAELVTWDPREDASDRHRTVDDRPYGGGPGMVMRVEPLATTLDRAKSAAEPAPVSYLSPQGRTLTQGAIRELARRPRLILLCGRYEGIDERLLDESVDEEWSIGDFVISGGELAAAMVIDAVLRMLPGVLGDADSAEEDSFGDGLLDCPHYSRPEEWRGRRVPEVLLGGDHAAIARWRRREALGRTWLRRPDLLARAVLSDADRALLGEYIDEYRNGRAARGRTEQSGIKPNRD